MDSVPVSTGYSLSPPPPTPTSHSPKRRRVDRSSSSIDPIAGPRPTQRAPKSCLECTRRKIKCDKDQPCGACVSRGDAGGCRREAVFVKGAIISGNLAEKAITLESLSKEIESLRQRVTDLESRKSRSSEGQSIPARARSDGPVDGPQISEVDQGRLPGTMEEIALGIGESIRWKGASLLTSREGEGPTNAAQWYQPITLETSLSALPSQPNCRALVTYYLEEVSWMSCSVHGPTLLTEHDSFWRKLDRSELKDDLWLGILFAVLSVSAFFMDENQAAIRGFSFQHLKVVGSAWFDSAIATLFRCGIWTRPSILTCQILQILGPAFHLTNNTNLHQSLTGLERTQMRSINLHLLGSNKEDAQQEVVWKEIGRRIWWNNVESDWIFIPYNKYAQFPPHQFTTALPEIPDESSPNSDGSLTLTYRLACYRSARFIYDVYGHLGLTDEPSYERVLSASRAHDALRAGLPAELRFDAHERSSYGLFPMACTRRRLLALILAYRCYQLHRLFFVKSFSDRAYDASRHACLWAADTITAVADLGLPRVFFQLWNVTVSLVSAGIILAFQLLQDARSRNP
ncbi:hypothetical protein DB88DRAFT_512348, partial [Papiliotrema laurentii]